MRTREDMSILCWDRYNGHDGRRDVVVGFGVLEDVRGSDMGEELGGFELEDELSGLVL